MEFEGKVLLTPEQYINIISSPETKSIKKLVKFDTYYSKFPSSKIAKEYGESLTRIRVESDKSYLTLKHREVIDGFETNVENETQIENVNILKQLLTESGYAETFKKYKTSFLLESYKVLDNDGEVHVELETISNGKDKILYALEIECVGEDIDPKYAKQCVIDAFNSYGFSSKKLEPKTWRELLTENEKENNN